MTIKEDMTIGLRCWWKVGIFLPRLNADGTQILYQSGFNAELSGDCNFPHDALSPPNRVEHLGASGSPRCRSLPSLFGMKSQ